MPFAAPIMDDENDPNKKNQQNGVNISGQSTSFATNVPGQDAGNSPKGKGSGQYANIQSYLDANKDQANQMGQKITSDVDAQASQAQTKVADFEKSAPKVEAYDPNAAIKKATALSDQEKTQYKDVKKTGGYTGPATVDGVSGYQDAQKAASSAAQNVQNAGTETGQQQLLKQTYARPQYSAGENRLDQVLLQNSAGSRANLENLSQKYSGIDKMFNDASLNVGNKINEATKVAAANKGAFASAEEAARKALLNPIQARAEQANATNKDYVKRIQEDAADEILSEETLKALGLSEGTRLFDLNIGNYITPDLTQVGINNAATADERQKYAALAALFDDPTMSQITADGKAIKPISFNDKFAKDLAARQAEFDKYAAATRATGAGTAERYGDIEAWAEANGSIADYLSGKAPNIDSWTIFGRGNGAAPIEDDSVARQRAVDDYKRQVDNYLNQQKYNRIIKKG